MKIHKRLHKIIQLSLKMISSSIRSGDFDSMAPYLKKINERFYYYMQDEIGQGTSGKVFKGYDSETDTIIAVKRIKRDDSSDRLNREIKVMETLAKIKHPNIVSYYGSFKNEKHVFFMMELCTGGTLSELLKRDEKISEYRVITLFKQILSAMVYINKQKTMHRDLKPDNILLDENGDLKIADFGLARSFEPNLTITRWACTPIYGAPEIFKEKPKYGEKCDIWSAGLILYQMLTGQKIFDDKKINDLPELVKNIQKFNNKEKKVKIPMVLEEEWNKIISFMVCYKADKRKSFQELYQYFTSIEKGLRQSIIKKYDLKEQKLQMQIEASRLCKTLSPYHLTETENGQRLPPIKNKKRNMLEEMVIKFKYEHSYNILNNFRKWVEFTRQKNILYTGLINVFVQKQYNLISNFHKYVLMFLSGMIFMARCRKGINELEKMKIKTLTGQEINMKDVLEEHREKIELLMQVEKGRLEKYFKNYREKYLVTSILPKLHEYMNVETEKGYKFKTRLMEYDNLQQIIKQVSLEIYHPEYIYSNLYDIVVESTPVFIDRDNLHQLSEAQLYVYFQIRLIRNLDYALPNTKYENEDFLKVELQKILNVRDQKKWEQQGKLKQQLHNMILNLSLNPKMVREASTSDQKLREAPAL